jgi:hypothetical protein
MGVGPRQLIDMIWDMLKIPPYFRATINSSLFITGLLSKMVISDLRENIDMTQKSVAARTSTDFIKNDKFKFYDNLPKRLNPGCPLN